MKQQIILFEEDKQMFLAKNEILEKVSSSVQKEYNDFMASNDVLRQSLETKFNLLQNDKSLEQKIEIIKKEIGDTMKCFDAEKKVFENEISKLKKVLEQRVKDFDEEYSPPEVLMGDNQTMAELLQAPTEGYEDAIVIPEIAANNFELKNGLINLVQNKQFFGYDNEDAHAYICYFNKITSTMRVPNYSLNSDAGGNFLDKMPRECMKIIESKSKVHQSRAKAVVAKVSTSSSTPAISPDVVELKDMVRSLLLDKKNQSSAPTLSSTPAPVKAVDPNCVTCGGTHSYQNYPATSGDVYRDNIQEYVSLAAAVNYNQRNNGFRPQMAANQI
uniref:Reverse transcriptase domain-containing protein n=1 Tax=Tanacetum cinerariifolium TaxID=118510 RepID=A0A699JA54_TANCI|nr:reverse transcriptase domain-containing protein [Tanacetum cinerariifolium]